MAANTSQMYIYALAQAHCGRLVSGKGVWTVIKVPLNFLFYLTDSIIVRSRVLVSHHHKDAVLQWKGSFRALPSTRLWK